jgi:hypothetical protein
LPYAVGRAARSSSWVFGNLISSSDLVGVGVGDAVLDAVGAGAAAGVDSLQALNRRGNRSTAAARRMAELVIRWRPL